MKNHDNLNPSGTLTPTQNITVCLPKWMVDKLKLIAHQRSAPGVVVSYAQLVRDALYQTYGMRSVSVDDLFAEKR